MLSVRTTALAVGLALAALPGRARAQIDYRNLDDERPVLTEDAYPIERYAFEFLFPFRAAWERAGADAYVIAPELAYGLFANGQVGLKLPFAAVDNGVSTRRGLAATKLFAMYNFNTEGRGLPAFMLRTDLSLPVGALAGNDARVTVKGIATRSWGLTRLHVNAARSFGAEDELGVAEVASRWAFSAAVDRTFFRQSLLVIGEVAALQAVCDAATEVDASVGMR